MLAVSSRQKSTWNFFVLPRKITRYGDIGSWCLWRGLLSAATTVGVDVAVVGRRPAEIAHVATADVLAAPAVVRTALN